MWLELVTVFLLSVGFIGLLRNLGSLVGLIDVPNERSIHQNIVPKGAGIGFISAILSVLYLFHAEIAYTHLWSILAVISIFCLGIWDDYRNTSPNTKFFVIIFATVLLYLDGIVIDELGTFFGQELHLGWLSVPFTIFAVSGFTNAMNLIDGLDGLAATLSIIILGVFMIVGIVHGDTFMTVLASLTIAALAAFLLFNWHPASIFMGDSGSLTLGFLISLLAIKSLAYLPTVSILFIAAIPILDTLIVMIRRKRNGRSAFLADKCHIHHLVQTFFEGDTKRAVISLGVLQAVYSLTGLQLDRSSDEGILLLLFILNVVLLYMILGAMIKRQKRSC